MARVKYKFEVLDENNNSIEPNEFGEIGEKVTYSREKAFKIINNWMYGWCTNVRITISVNGRLKNSIITDSYAKAELFLFQNQYA